MGRRDLGDALSRGIKVQSNPKMGEKDTDAVLDGPRQVGDKTLQGRIEDVACSILTSRDPAEARRRALAHSNLIPLIERLKSTGRTRTFDMPAQIGREWTRFFRKIGLGHLCFHCTRVSVVTRLCRAGVSQPQAMRFVGHASETIHRIYQRLRAEDVSACVSALRIPLSENPDAPSATPKRDRASSASHNRTEIRPSASPKRTTASDRCAQQAVLH